MTQRIQAFLLDSGDIIEVFQASDWRILEIRCVSDVKSSRHWRGFAKFAKGRIRIPSIISFQKVLSSVRNELVVLELSCVEKMTTADEKGILMPCPNFVYL